MRAVVYVTEKLYCLLACPSGCPDTVGQVWLGRGPVTAADEEQEAAAALAEQRYYAQLHATAAEQAKMHGELRDTFVLKAYKGRCLGCS
jgi:hypothetical protein